MIKYVWAIWLVLVASLVAVLPVRAKMIDTVDEYTVDKDGQPIWIRYQAIQSINELEAIAGNFDVGGKTYKALLPSGYDYGVIYLVYYLDGNESIRLHERRHAIEGNWHTPWQHSWFSGWWAVDKQNGKTIYGYIYGY